MKRIFLKIMEKEDITKADYSKCKFKAGNIGKYQPTLDEIKQKVH